MKTEHTSTHGGLLSVAVRGHSPNFGHPPDRVLSLHPIRDISVNFEATVLVFFAESREPLRLSASLKILRVEGKKEAGKWKRWKGW